MVFLLHFQIWLKIMKGLIINSGENWLTDKEKDKWELTKLVKIHKICYKHIRQYTVT